MIFVYNRSKVRKLEKLDCPVPTCLQLVHKFKFATSNKILYTCFVMTRKEENKIMISALKKQRKETIASKETAKAFLVKMGVYDMLLSMEENKNHPDNLAKLAK